MQPHKSLMKSPKVSVVIPSYNRAGTLSRSVTSVLAQTEGDFELIVVDDGSTDNTPSLISSLRDPRIRWEHHIRNRGPAAARNTGVSAAKGKWIAFLDSDDEWLPEKLELQLAHISERAPEAWGVCCGLYLREKGYGSVKTLIPPSPSHWHKHLLLGCNLGPGTTLMVARQAFDEIGFLDEKFRRFEDWEWLLRFVKRFPLTTVSEPLAIVHRERHAGAPLVEQAALRLVSLYRNEARGYGLLFERKFRARRWMHLAWLYFAEKNLSKGLKYFIRAICNDPAPPPGMLLLLLDSLLGTAMACKAGKLNRRLIPGSFEPGMNRYARPR